MSRPLLYFVASKCHHCLRGVPLQVREELLQQVEELKRGKTGQEITSKDYTAKERAQQGSEALCG